MRLRLNEQSALDSHMKLPFAPLPLHGLAWVRSRVKRVRNRGVTRQPALLT